MIRIVGKLDIKGPNLVKGVQYEGNRVLGSAEKFSQAYYEAGIDEMIYQDVVASLYKRNGLTEVVQNTASACFVPLTVAGGIRSVDDARIMLRNGADKIGINSAALARPELITELAEIFGSQCVVVVVEAWFDGTNHFCWYDFGRERTRVDAFDWVRRVEDYGAGEVLLSSVNRDGLGVGFDIGFTAKVAGTLSIPVLAAGGAGTMEHVAALIEEAKPAGVVLSSLLHYHYCTATTGPTLNFIDSRLRLGDATDSGNIDFLKDGYGSDRSLFVSPCSIPALKDFLTARGIPVRLTHVDQEEVNYG